jgi:outer membrane lipopolysaccharide assembly protein LptE/RlpB
MKGLIGFILTIFIIALTAGCIFHYKSDNSTEKQLNEMSDNSIAISERPDSLSVTIETP